VITIAFNYRSLYDMKRDVILTCDESGYRSYSEKKPITARDDVKSVLGEVVLVKMGETSNLIGLHRVDQTGHTKFQSADDKPSL